MTTIPESNTLQFMFLGDSSAFNKELIIDIDGDSIAGYALIAAGNKPKATVILIAGYPGNDNNFDLAQDLRNNGYNVVSFNHRGAWGSQGYYSYSNCLEDVGKLVEFLSEEKVATELRIESEQFILLGRSFGGGIALIAGSEIKAVQKIIAITSVNYGQLMQNYQVIDDLGSFKKYMQKQIMINADIDHFLQDLLDNKKTYNILQYKNELQTKNVMLIDDSVKNQEWVKELVSAEAIVLESDHNFIEQREELIGMIISWLKM